MEETEEKLPYGGVCKTSILEARMMALQVAQDMDRGAMFTQEQLLEAAEQVFEWMVEGLE